MAYEQFDHTADIGIKATGETLEETFGEAAKGLFSVITDIDKVESVGEYRIEMSAHDHEELLVDFLSELIYLFEVESLLFSEFDVSITSNDEKKLAVTARGEEIDDERHELLQAVKAVSYHDIKVDQEGEIRVIFDV